MTNVDRAHVMLHHMCMDTHAPRRTSVSFQPPDQELLEAFLDEDGPELLALRAAVGFPIDSDSSRVRALSIVGAREIRRRVGTEAYNRAVEAGDFDESHRRVRDRRRRGAGRGDRDG